ncbi:RICIN domain-containing protein [Nonomuraea sp. LPB2021202275-12-8]|uniref:RICIN domain-containing protein n=1 Tax=Nonomuraea sp. LPB2021202275-12-8 TaxID=3120159 RepID=UPI00300D971D
MHISSVKKIAVAAAAAATAFAATITLLPPAASAANMGPGTGILRSWATGRCLDSNHAGHVYTLPCQDGNGYQIWVETGFWTTAGRLGLGFRNKATGLCLATNAPGALYTTTCTEFGNWTMYWDIWGRPRPGTQAPSRVFVFTHGTTNQCLDSNHAGNAYTHACGSNYQDWKDGM